MFQNLLLSCVTTWEPSGTTVAPRLAGPSKQSNACIFQHRPTTCCIIITRWFIERITEREIRISYAIFFVGWHSYLLADSIALSQLVAPSSWAFGSSCFGISHIQFFTPEARAIHRAGWLAQWSDGWMDGKWCRELRRRLVWHNSIGNEFTQQTYTLILLLPSYIMVLGRKKERERKRNSSMVVESLFYSFHIGQVKDKNTRSNFPGRVISLPMLFQFLRLPPRQLWSVSAAVEYKQARKLASLLASLLPS